MVFLRSKGTREDLATEGKSMVGRMLSNQNPDQLGDQLARVSLTDDDETHRNELEKVDFVSARKPGVTPKMWSTEDDSALRAAVEKFGEKNWRTVAEHVPGRNHVQCVQRWRKVLAPGLVKGHWTREEDSTLVALIDQNVAVMGSIGKVDWNWVSNHVPGRSVKQCRERWYLNLDPSINRGPWTSDEDNLLLELVGEIGPSWSRIAKELPGRTENSVKTRHQSLLRRQARLRGWTSGEDSIVLAEAQLVGRNWSVIARKIKGRTAAQVKRRFNTLVEDNPAILEKVQDCETRLGFVADLSGPMDSYSPNNSDGDETDYMPQFDSDALLELANANTVAASRSHNIQRQDSWGINKLLQDLSSHPEMSNIQPNPVTSTSNFNNLQPNPVSSLPTFQSATDFSILHEGLNSLPAEMSNSNRMLQWNAGLEVSPPSTTTTQKANSGVETVDSANWLNNFLTSTGAEEPSHQYWTSKHQPNEYSNYNEILTYQ